MAHKTHNPGAHQRKAEQLAEQAKADVVAKAAKSAKRATTVKTDN
jgi:hypothetical protein